MPSSVITNFGYGLYQAQLGEYPDIAKTLSGFGNANVIELIENEKNGTFRAVYTLQFEDAIIVLHAFQKKSKKGISTPKKEIDLVNRRLKLAENLYNKWKEKENG